MRRALGSGVTSCPAATAGRQGWGEPFWADRISYKGRSTLSQHRGAEQSTNHTMRCCREDFRSPSVLCASTPPSQAMRGPSSIWSPGRPWSLHKRLSGSGTVTLTVLSEGRGRTWLGSFSQTWGSLVRAHEEECISFFLTCCNHSIGPPSAGLGYGKNWNLWRHFSIPQPTAVCWLSLVISTYPWAPSHHNSQSCTLWVKKHSERVWFSVDGSPEV